MRQGIQIAPARLNPKMGREDGWIRLCDIDLTALASVDLGTTAGAKSIGGVSWTLVNGGTYLSSLALVQGTGLVMTTHATNASVVTDLNAGTGPYLHVALSSLIPSGLWPATEVLVRNKYRSIFMASVVDFSAAVADTQEACVGLANSTALTHGYSAGAGFMSGAQGVRAVRQAATESADTQNLSDTGLSALPTVCCVDIAKAGGGCWWGTSPGGLRFPADIYTDLKYDSCGAQKNANVTGSAIAQAGVFFFGAGCSNAAAKAFVLKRVSIWGMNPKLYTPLCQDTGVHIQA